MKLIPSVHEMMDDYDREALAVEVGTPLRRRVHHPDLRNQVLAWGLVPARLHLAPEQ